ncbi:MAG TPA: zinc carboxypeptidase, partial [Agriterribacter sp.]|nr:zinc carboxypeptidase [Agriterribacter sp.]
LVNSEDFKKTNWNDFDVLILSDGNFPFLNDKDFVELRQWISGGGKIIAMENAVAQLAGLNNGGIKFKKDDAEQTAGKANDYSALKKFGDHERESISATTPGSIFRIQLDNSHPLAFGYPDYYYSLKMDDHAYQFSDDGWNVGIIKKDNLVSGFVGSTLKKKLIDGLVFGVQDIGKGNIVYLANNLLFRNFWQNGKLMFCNALFLVGQ